MVCTFLWDIPNSKIHLQIRDFDLIKMYQNSGIIPFTVTCEKCGAQMEIIRLKKCLDGYAVSKRNYLYS